MDFDDALAALDLLRDELLRLKGAGTRSVPDPVKSRHRRRWKSWELALLLTGLTDEEIAQRTGRLATAVRKMRQEMEQWQKRDRG